ncbi:MAG: sulfotransferase [Alphaproteobacteria bacterium]
MTDPTAPDHAAKRLDFRTAGLPCRLPVTVHIGYPRTASTFLTKQVYYKHPDLATSHWLWQLVERQALGDAADRRANLMVDIRLSGWVERDRTDLAVPLKEALPNAKILCFVREQRSMIRAQHFLYLKSGGLRSLAAFARSRMDGLLHYDRLYDAYAEAFGPDALLFLPYEALQHDHTATIDRVLRWIGVDPARLPARQNERVKPSAGGHVASALLLRNWLVAPIAKLLPGSVGEAIYRRGVIGARYINRLGSYIPAQNEAALDASIMRHYGAANDRLFAKLGLPAGAFGYPSATATRAV